MANPDNRVDYFELVVKWMTAQGFKVVDGVLYDGELPRGDLRSLANCIIHPDLMTD